MNVSPVSIVRRGGFRDGVQVNHNQHKVRKAYRMMRQAGMPAYDARYIVIQLLLVGLHAEVAHR